MLSTKLTLGSFLPSVSYVVRLPNNPDFEKNYIGLILFTIRKKIFSYFLNL